LNKRPESSFECIQGSHFFRFLFLKLGFNLIFSPEVKGILKFNNPGAIFLV
jgi:hypothetical protein